MSGVHAENYFVDPRQDRMSSKIPIIPPFVAITRATEPASGLASLDFQISKWHVSAGLAGIVAIIVAIWLINKGYKNYRRTGRIMG